MGSGHKAQQLYKAGAGLDVGTDNNNAVTAFAAGKTAMMFNSSAVAASVANSTTFPYVALPSPLSAPASKAGTVVGPQPVEDEQARRQGEARLRRLAE